MLAGGASFEVPPLLTLPAPPVPVGTPPIAVPPLEAPPLETPTPVLEPSSACRPPPSERFAYGGRQIFGGSAVQDDDPFALAVHVPLGLSLQVQPTGHP